MYRKGVQYTAVLQTELVRTAIDLFAVSLGQAMQAGTKPNRNFRRDPQELCHLALPSLVHRLGSYKGMIRSQFRRIGSFREVQIETKHDLPSRMKPKCSLDRQHDVRQAT